MSICCEENNCLVIMELKRFKRPEGTENFKNHINVVIKGESSGEVKISLIIKMACDYYYFKHNEMFKIMDCGRNRPYIQICADFNVISSCVITTILDFAICHLKYLNCIHCYLMSVYFYRYNCLLKSFFCMCLVCVILLFTNLFPFLFYLFFNICPPFTFVSGIIFSSLILFISSNCFPFSSSLFTVFFFLRPLYLPCINFFFYSIKAL